MRLKILIFITFLVGFTLDAQRLSLGYTIGTTAFQQTTLPDNYLIPQHSYFIYYTANEKKDYKPVYDQYLNGVMGGINASIDYKRYMLTLEMLFSTNKIKIPVYYPSYLGNSLDGNWGEYVVEESAFTIPLLFTYKLTTKANGPYILLGAQYSFMQYREDNRDLESSVPSAAKVLLADTEMYGILYNSSDYARLVFGAGYKKDDMYFAVRLYQTINIFSGPEPLASYFRVDLTYSQTLNFQKLRKGPIIYTE